jgi:class 3 adenylate cyclase
MDEADGWLDQSIRTAVDGKHAVAEGFARKDRALLLLLRGDLEAAAEECGRAQQLFASAHFNEGSAKAALVEAMVLREQQRWGDAEQKLRAALAHFEKAQGGDDTVRAWWERARIELGRKAPSALISRAYAQALSRAEALRHDPLVRGIEREFHDVDPEGYLRHIYKRARGLGIDEDDPSLMEGRTESATVLFIDLPNFTEFSQSMGPQEVLVTFNHLMGDFADVLAKQGGLVVAYRGNGIMALTRESRHAERAVLAAQDLVSALAAFNAPREMLGLPVFLARIGIASGDVLLGNVGTYRKMDFTAIGQAVNVAAALRNEARYGKPCISRGTYEIVRGRFAYESEEPRVVQVAGYGAVDVWDVAERR